MKPGSIKSNWQLGYFSSGDFCAALDIQCPRSAPAAVVLYLARWALFDKNISLLILRLSPLLLISTRVLRAIFKSSVDHKHQVASRWLAYPLKSYLFLYYRLPFQRGGGAIWDLFELIFSHKCWVLDHSATSPPASNSFKNSQRL